MGSPKPEHLLKHIMMMHNRTGKQDLPYFDASLFRAKDEESECAQLF